MKHMPDETEEVLHPIGETARQLGVSIDTIRRWESEDKIHGIRTAGGQRRFRQSEINRLLEVEHVA